MPESVPNSSGRVNALSPEHRDAAVKLDGFLKVKRRLKKQRYPAEMTLFSVKRDAAKILEKFLIKHLSMGDNVKAHIDQAYQRVEEIDVEEDCSIKQPSGHAKSATDPDVNSIPYADDDLTRPIRSKSLPTGTQKIINARQTVSNHNLLANTIKSDEVSGHKTSSGSKSFSHSYPKSKSSSPQKGEKSISSLSTDKSADSDTIQPHTLDPRMLAGKGDTSHSTTPSPLEGYSPSLSVSSSESSSSGFSTGRRKKSVFKRYKERLIHAFSKQNKNKYKVTRKEHKPSKINKLSTKDDGNDGEILEDRHTHRKTCVKQSHQKGCHDQGLIRTEDTWVTTDIIEPPKSSKKHIKKHKKVKESSSTSFENAGFAQKLKYLTSFRRGSKKQSIDAGSIDSADTGGRSLERASSVSVDTGSGCVRDYTEEREKTSPGHRETHATHIRTDCDPGYIERRGSGQADADEKKDVPAPAPPSSLPGTYGQNGGCSLNMDGFSISGLPDAVLRGSFVVDYECDLHEQKIRSPDGQVTCRVDVDEHKHIILPEDVEMDGIESDESQPSTEQTMAEKDELYGIIADKLAAIGDDYVAKKHVAVISPSPVISSAGAVGGQSPADNKTSLEREIQDRLRSLGDSMTEKYALSECVKNAAMEIVKKATYKTFKQSMRSTIGDDIGLAQLAMLYIVTKKTIGLAGAGGALALQVKEMFLRYFEDRFAGLILEHGGWESMLDSDSGESDYGVD